MSRSSCFILILIGFVFCWCINPVSAFTEPQYTKFPTHNNSGVSNTYSITQVSDYKSSLHCSLSAQHDPDVDTLKKALKQKGWTEKFHHKNADVTEGDFTTIDDMHSADIHIHMGHGHNFWGVTQVELSNHLIPANLCLFNCEQNKNFVTPVAVKNKWNHKWVILYSCDLFEDHAWFCGLTEDRGRGVLGFGSTTYAHYNYMTKYFENANHLTIAEAWGETNRALNGPDEIQEDVIARVIFKNKDMMEKDSFPTSHIHFKTQPSTQCTAKPFGYEYSSKDKGNGHEFIPTVNCNCNKKPLMKQ